MPHSAGVEAWAEFHTPELGDLQERWQKLAHALSGLTCASTNFLGTETNTLRRRSNSAFIGGKLPREAVCTENLSPWIKMLPCRQEAGLASLLNSYQIYKSDFSVMSLFARTSPDGEVELEQALFVVADPVRLGRVRDQETPELAVSKNQSWMLSSLLDRTLTEVCTAAESTVIRLKLPPKSNTAEYALNERHPLADKAKIRITKISDIPGEVVYRIDTPAYPIKRQVRKLLDETFDDGFDIGISWNTLGLNVSSARLAADVDVKRVLTGYGQESAGIRMVIKAVSSVTRQGRPRRVLLVQPLPWWLNCWMHDLSFKLYVNDTKVENAVRVLAPSIAYKPAKRRRSPAFLEVELWVPAEGLITMDFQADFEHLRVAEHPPGASRGFDLWPAELAAIDDEGKEEYSLYTAPLLIRMPTPDFSMPYNVITLTCTILALFFGSTLNALVRKFKPVKVAKNSLPCDTTACHLKRDGDESHIASPEETTLAKPIKNVSAALSKKASAKEKPPVASNETPESPSPPVANRSKARAKRANILAKGKARMSKRN